MQLIRLQQIFTKIDTKINNYILGLGKMLNIANELDKYLNTYVIKTIYL